MQEWPTNRYSAGGRESTQRVFVGVALEALFEFLFKYRPVVFEKGRLAFAAPGT